MPCVTTSVWTVLLDVASYRLEVSHTGYGAQLCLTISGAEPCVIPARGTHQVALISTQGIGNRI